MNNIGNTAFLFLLLLGFIAETTGIDSTCTIHRQRGQSGRLCCQFSEDIGRQKRAFQVKRQPFSTTDKNPEILLDCVWLKNFGLDCKILTPKAIEFGNNVSSKIDIDIPVLSSDYDGEYECVLVPPDGSQVSTCRYYNADYIQPIVTPAKRHNPGTTTAKYNGSSNSPSSGNKNIYIIVIAIMAVIAVASIFAAVVMFKYRRSTPVKQYGPVQTNMAT